MIWSITLREIERGFIILFVNAFKNSKENIIMNATQFDLILLSAAHVYICRDTASYGDQSQLV